MRLELKFSLSLLLLLVSNEAQAELQLSSSLNCYLIMHEVRAELQLSSRALSILNALFSMLYGCIERRDLYPVACLDVCAQNLEKIILEILSTTDGKKNSRLTTKISRFLRFAQTKNLEIYVSRET